MGRKENYDTIQSKFERLGMALTAESDNSDMGKAERKALVLKFLADKRLALPPKVLYRNLRLLENATFSEKSLTNYLGELEDAGLVERVDPDKLEDRELRPVDEDERGYYFVTDRGIEAAPDDVELRHKAQD